MSTDLKQPNIKPIRNAEFGFGFIPGKRGPLYQNQEDWIFVVDMGNGCLRGFTIPAGYIFNAASVPPCLWGWPFGYTPDGVHRAAAMEHDYLCDLGIKGTSFRFNMILQLGIKRIPECVPHKVAHKHFHLRMAEYGMRSAQVTLFAWAVRNFGPRWKTS